VEKAKHKPFGNLLMGIRFSSLLKLIIKNGISLKPVYILRFFALLPTSLISELFMIIEIIKYRRKADQTVIEKPPVFIIGHWRSGTTFLHQLVFLDKQFTAPTFVQTVIPEHFIFSTKYWVPVLEKMVPKKRPMDDVEMKPEVPMEDEWALFKLGAPTPFRKIFFPSRKFRFYGGTGEYIPEGKDLVKWKKIFLRFLKKITFLTKKRIILKNPFHTPRIAILAEMFPGAKFIHIVRHPYKIVPSTINMWNIVSGENAFKSGWVAPTVGETANVINDFWESVEENRKTLSELCFTEVRYEDLEKDPVGEIKRMYKDLGLIFTSDFKNEITMFMAAKKNYKKNSFNLSQEEMGIITEKLRNYILRYRY
jgi:omega-hydroxy-beta-dihydromenaquinone-9 sulfotransferase